MGTTSLVEELTKTYFPPPLTHLSAQALCPALAPFAPQPLSLIHPVHESAFTGMLKARNKTAAIARVENTFFMFIPLPLGAEILYFPWALSTAIPKWNWKGTSYPPCQFEVSE